MTRVGQRNRLLHRAFGRSENSGAESRPRARGPAHLAAQGSKRPHFPAALGTARAVARTPSTATSAGGRAPRPGSRPPVGAAAPGPPRAPAVVALVCAV
uniref:Uncharacterized protein n=1 Tax=Castor canadensis TaxID=51338 RepID=A0A8C0ZTD6_CASCN